MNGIKISVEHDDVGVAAAIGAIIDDALTKHGFTNVKGKMVMVYQEVTRDVGGAIVPNFSKKSQLLPLINPTEVNRPKMYSTELLPARIAFGYPVLSDWLKEKHPTLLAGPVLIDTNIESMPYQEQLKTFLSGDTQEEHF